jgi:aminoglycoside phosphotransferase (APT) family kinase protein
VNLPLPRQVLRTSAELKAHVLQGGHSGAEVILFTDEADTFVRKRAQRTTGSARLLKQAVKQRLFAAQGLGFPRVRDMGLDATRRAWFEMDYVPARTLGDLVRTQAPFDGQRIVAAIANLLMLFRATESGTLSADLFRSKIADIARVAGDNIAAAKHLPELRRVAAALEALDWSGIPVSISHGDLTFENILIAPDGAVSFIDCDEPFASSWWLDAGKLFQDIAGAWCLHTLTAPSVGITERLVRFDGELRGLAAELDPALPSRLLQFAALHLLRTVPYSRSEAAALFAIRRAARLLEIGP